MNVPFVDLLSNYRRAQESIDANIRAVIEDTQFIGGEQVKNFEQSFAEYLGVEHGIGVGSGTDAIRIALETLGVGPGDEVVTVSHTFVSTVDGIVHNGARPRFVDIDPETYTMDVDQVEEAISDRTAALMPVHLYGQPVELDQLLEIADKYDVPLLEDACQAHGAEYKGQTVGQFGDIACYSFYPSKNLGAFGDGGFIATDDESLAAEARALREYGETEKYTHERVGYNSRLDTLQAAVLDAKLPHLDRWNEERRTAAKYYTERLIHLPLKTPTESDKAEHVYHLYVIRTRDEQERDALLSYLEDEGVDTSIHYPVPVHKQPSYVGLESNFRQLPVTERVARRIVSLPMYPEITIEEIHYVCDCLRTFYE